MGLYNWDKEFNNVATTNVTYDVLFTSLAFSAIRSCIEADEPKMLADVINQNKKAQIYALLLCFTTRPSVKCIEYLIHQGVNLDETFTNNPFNCTPQQYLDSHFMDTNKIYSKARAQIYKAIEKGNSLAKTKEHIIIPVKSEQGAQKRTMSGEDIRHNKCNNDVTDDDIMIRCREKAPEKPTLFRLATVITDHFKR